MDATNDARRADLGDRRRVGAAKLGVRLSRGLQNFEVTAVPPARPLRLGA